MTRRVIVTGADGFLGTHICRQLDARGWRVLRLTRRAQPGSGNCLGVELPSDTLAAVLRDFQPNALVHAAGPASVPKSCEDPQADFRGTVDITAAILDQLRKYSPDCRFAYLSSGAVYGDATTGGVPESASISPLSPYAFHKRMSELLCEEYQRLYGLKTVVFRIFSAYGEGQRKQVVHDFVKKLLAADLPTLDILGTGQEARDFIHAEDIAMAIETALAAGAEGQINIGSGEATSIASLARLVVALAGSRKEPVFTGQTRVGDPSVMWADTTRMASLGIVPAITLEEGLRRYIRWYTQDQERHKERHG